VIFRVNQASGIPLYLQLMEQVKHAVETGALKPGEQLPTIRKVAVDLVVNPNTVVRAYRELEHEGVLEVKHGSGAYIKETAVGRAGLMRKAQTIVQSTVERLLSLELSTDEIRRVVENELSQSRANKHQGKEPV
jgi:GntR family transcriptional regulator